MFDALAVSGLTLLIGLISLFHDSKGGRRITIALGACLLILFSVESLAGYHSEQARIQAEEDKALAEAETGEYREAMLTLTRELDSRTKEVVTEVIDLKDLLVRQLGFSEERAETASAESIGESFKAAQTVQGEILVTTPEDSARREATTLQYFAKGFDGNIVSNTLTQLGFNPQTFTPNYPEIPTNAIWVGDNIPVEDAKAIALSLLSAGVELKSVRTFPPNSANRGRDIIQVGSDKELYEDNDCAPLSYDQIQSAQQIDRNNLVCGN